MTYSKVIYTFFLNEDKFLFTGVKTFYCTSVCAKRIGKRILSAVVQSVPVYTGYSSAILGPCDVVTVRMASYCTACEGG